LWIEEDMIWGLRSISEISKDISKDMGIAKRNQGGYKGLQRINWIKGIKEYIRDIEVYRGIC